jgi:Beta-ketoacyl synthase, N-terminal domain
MLFIHHTTCISPQQTFTGANLLVPHEPVDNMLKAIEPTYSKIPAGILRRMAKPMRMGVAAAMHLFHTWPAPDGIIIGTANAGMEDCFLFLQQIVEYGEGILTPTHFVQSTPNGVAGQLGILNKNNGYNITHTHLGLAFENALIDALMMLKENPGKHYLLGAIDDISFYNYTFSKLAGWYKAEHVDSRNLYNSNTPGSIAGEGATMFLVNGEPANAIAKLNGISTLHSTDEMMVQKHLENFLQQNLPKGEKIDLFLSGENGDSRLLTFYTSCEALLENEVAIFRYKHLCGEYPTAASFAVWLACYLLQQNPVPGHIVKRKGRAGTFKNILLYNNYRGMQHGFILLSKVLA